MATRDQRLVSALTRWFDASARDLPWRRDRNGYTALVAEAMLQQTQVSRVLEKYDAFLARFPSIHDLAAAAEQDVLAAWQGLGYYRRARHLHEAAKLIVAEHDGEVPADAATLRRLPGVGRYTAGSIASIVHGKREPIVDGNVQRVLARWEADAGPATERDTIARTWDRAAALVTIAPDPGRFNEAMMELGALVCTPATPRCVECPVRRDCRAHRQGRQGQIPPPRPAPAPRAVHFHTVVIDRRGTVLLERRPETGLWSGLWQTPTVEAPRRLPPREVKRRLPVTVTSLDFDRVFDYRTTHRLVTFHVYRGRTRQRRGTWRDPGRAEDLPMSNAMRRVLAGAQANGTS